MILEGAATVVAGGLVGAVIAHYYERWAERLRRRSRGRTIARRRAILDDHPRVASWLVDYYTSRGRDDQLFRCRIGDVDATVPFLTTADWQRGQALTPGAATPFRYTRTETDGLDIDKKLIARRRRLGQRVFDDACCYMDDLRITADSLSIHVSPCRYFEVVTPLLRLEEETVRLLEKGTFPSRLSTPSRTPVRDAHLPGVHDPARLFATPRPVGCAVVLALKTGDHYEILIQSRSHETVTVGGSRAVMPNFTLTPVPDHDVASEGRRGEIFYYNFVREYLEELFDYEPLIRAANSSRVDAFWFYSQPEAQDLDAAVMSGDMQVEFLGFGLDALSGSGVAALLAVVEDQGLASRLRGTMRANWEVGRDEAGVIDAKLVRADSPLLGQWLERSDYHSGAAFALSLALQRLESAQPSPA